MENESQTNKCPKCGGIVSSGKAGTITQWIATCNCSVVSDSEDTLAEVIEICAGCGKRINPGRSGTFTQWIFRLDLCSCEVPQPVKKMVEELELSSQIELTETEIEEPEEEGLEVNPEKFPVDRYKPLSILGKGSSGTVYLSWDRLLNKKIAVKTLHTLEQEQQVSFQREAKATSKLNHGNIIQVLDFGITDGGTPFMAMEYVDGKSLYEHIESKNFFSIEVALELFSNISAALAHAHEKGILHRDIKSSNVLLEKTKEGTFDSRLIDFGVAAFQTKHSQEDSQSKTMVGSPAYMPPDTALGVDYDERSEIYGLACTIFEALTGRTPFVSDTSLETIRQHAHEPPPLISDVAEDIEFPSELIALVDRCLSKSQDDRIQSMKELNEELLSIRSSLVEVPKPQTTTKTIEWTQLKNITRVSPKVLFTICLAVATIGTTVLIMTTQRGQAPEPNIVEPDIPITALTDVIGEAVGAHFSTHKIGPDKLQIRSRGEIENEDLMQLKENKVIHTLVLSGNKVTDEGLEAIVDIPIHTLFVKGQPLTDKSIDYLVKIKGLKSLDISKTKISDKGLKRIAGSIKLTYLGFGGRNTTNDSLKALAKLTDLVHLKLDGTQNVTGSGLLYLKKFPKLRKLSFHHCIFKPEDLNSLAKLKIDSIGFSRFDSPDSIDLSFASRLKLSSIGFVRSGISIDTVKKLSALKKLKKLSIVECGLKDKHVKFISMIPNLQSLDLRGSDITSSGILYLKKMKTLEQLDLRFCSKVNGKDILSLAHSLPECSISKPTARELDNRAFAEVTNSLLESTNQMRKHKDSLWKQ